MEPADYEYCIVQSILCANASRKIAPPARYHGGSWAISKASANSPKKMHM